MKAKNSPYYLLAQRSALTDTPRERGDSHTETTGFQPAEKLVFRGGGPSVRAAKLPGTERNPASTLSRR